MNRLKGASLGRSLAKYIETETSAQHTQALLSQREIIIMLNKEITLNATVTIKRGILENICWFPIGTLGSKHIQYFIGLMKHKFWLLKQDKY